MTLASCVANKKIDISMPSTSKEPYQKFFFLTADPMQSQDPEPSSRGIFYSENSATNFDIFLLSGKSKRRITKHKSDDFMPSFSESYKILAFLSRREDAKGDIHFKAIGSISVTDEFHLKLPDTEEMHPSWSADGTKFVFASKGFGQSDPKIMLFDWQSKKVQDTGLLGFHPRINNDGDRIVFQQNAQIHEYNLRTKQHNILTQSRGLNSQPDLSPDFKKLVFRRIDHDTNRDGLINGNDHGALWLLDRDLNLEFALTSDDDNPSQGRFFNDRILLSFTRGTAANLGLIPERGQWQAIYDHHIYIPEKVRHIAINQGDDSLKNLYLRFLWAMQTPQQEVARFTLEKLVAENPNYEIWRPYLDSFYKFPEIKNHQGLSKRFQSACKNSTQDSFFAASCLILSSLNNYLNNQGLNKARQSLTEVIQSTDQEPYWKRFQLLALKLSFAIDAKLSTADAAMLSLDQYLVAIEQSNPELSRELSEYAIKNHINSITRSIDQKINSKWLSGTLKISRYQNSDQKEIFLRHNQLLALMDQYKDLSYIYIKALEKALELPDLHTFSDSYLKVFQQAAPFLAKEPSQFIREEGRVLHELVFRRVGDYYVKSLEIASAIKFYRKGISIFPRSVALHKSLIDAYGMMKKIDDIKERYMAKSPDWLSQYLALYVDTYSIDQTQDLEERLEIIESLIPTLENIVEIKPQQADLHQTLGWLYYQHDLWTKRKSGPSAWYRLKSMLFGFFSQFSERFTLGTVQAIRNYQLALASLPPDHPNRAALLQNIGEAQFQWKNYSQAYSYYSRRVAWLDRVPFRSLREEGQIYLNYGRSAAQTKQYPIAESAFLKASQAFQKIGRQDQRLQIQQYRALNFTDQKKYMQAIEVYRNILDLPLPRETRVIVLTNLGMNLYYSKNYTKTIETLNQAIGLVDDAPREEHSDDIAVNLGGSSTEAQGFSGLLRKAQIQTYLAKAYLKKGDYSSTSTWLRRKIQSLKSQEKQTNKSYIDYRTVANNHLAYVLFLSGDYAEAAKTFWIAYDLAQKIENRELAYSNGLNLLVSLARWQALGKPLSTEATAWAQSVINNFSSQRLIRAYDQLLSSRGPIPHQDLVSFLSESIDSATQEPNGRLIQQELRDTFVGKGEAWTYLLLEDLHHEAYLDLAETKSLNSLSFIRLIVAYLDQVFLQSFQNIEPSQGFEAYQKHLLLRRQILGRFLRINNERLNIQSKDINRLSPQEGELVVGFLGSSPMYMVYKSDRKTGTQRLERFANLSQEFDFSSYKRVHLLSDKQSHLLYPHLKKMLPSTPIIWSGGVQVPRTVDVRLFNRISWLGDPSPDIIKANEHRESIPVNADQPKILYIAEPLNLSPSLSAVSSTLDLQETKNIDLLTYTSRIDDHLDILAHDLIREHLGANTVVVAESSDTLGQFFQSFANQGLQDAINTPGITILGLPGTPKKLIAELAPKLAYDQKQALENRLVFANVLDDVSLQSEILLQLRAKRSQSRQYTGAYYYQKKILNLIEDSADELDLADEYLNSGILALRAKSFKNSQEYFDKSLAIYQDNEDTYQSAVVIKNMALLVFEQKASEKGVELLKKSRQLFLEDDDQEAATERLLDMANYTRESLNDFSQALIWYRQALDEFKKQDFEQGIIRANIDYANTLMAVGSIKRAITVLESQEDYIDADDEPTLWLRNAQILLNAYYRASLFQEAINLHSKAKNILESIESENLRKLLSLDLANVHALVLAKIGQEATAVKTLNQSIEKARLLEKPRKVAQLLSNLAYIKRKMGELRQSVALFKEALTIDTQERDESAIAFDYRNLGISFLYLEDYEQASQFLNRARKDSERLSLAYNQVYSLVGLAELALARQEPEKAISHYQKALEVSQKSYLRQFIWRSYAGLASTYDRLKQWQIAESYYEKALEIVEKLRGSLSNLENSSGFQEERSVQRVYEDFIVNLSQQGKFKKAWQISERSRSRSLIDSLSNTSIRENSEEASRYADFTELLDQLQSVMERSPNPELKSQIDSITKKRQSLLEKIKKEDPRLYNIVTISSIGLDEVTAYLDPQTALIEYMITSGHLIVWIISEKGIFGAIRTLPRDRIELRIKQYRKILQSLGDLSFIGQELYAWLLEDWQSEFQDYQNLVIVPHGSLHYLPFAALPESREQYLIDRFRITYLESATLARFAKHSDLTSSPTIKAFGNPDRGKDLDLPFAAKEAQTIKRYFPSAQVLVGGKATANSFLSSHEADWIHIASHGEFHPFDPGRSRLLLAPSGGSSGDILVDQILSTRINAELVTLSACETGLGDIKGGDEVVSFNRAFFQAGARSIISTLWRIDDVASALTMKRFYRYLSEGNNKRAGLRKAQLLTKSYFPHPAYWSSYRLIGSYR